MKKTELFSKKCELLKVGSKSSYRFTYVDDKSITNSECTKYLGDHFKSFGTNSDLVDARVKKAKGSPIEVIAICKKDQFSSNQLSAMLLLLVARGPLRYTENILAYWKNFMSGLSFEVNI